VKKIINLASYTLLPRQAMRKLCPNFDKADGLDTVLEVPIPEEMLTNMGTTGFNRWQNLKTLMNNAQVADKSSGLSAPSNNEFIALLKLVGAPLIPLQVQSDHTLTRPLRDCSIVSIHYISTFFSWLDYSFNPLTFTKLRFWSPKKKNYKTAP